MISSARCAQLGLGAAALVLLSSLAVLGGRAVERQRDESSRAPDFRLRDTDGEAQTLASLRGKVVVLAFSSIHCRTCSGYSERMASLADRYGSTGHVAVLRIETGVRGNDSATLAEVRVQQLVSQQKFPTLIDDGGAVARLFQVDKTPTVVVIDGNGRIRYRGAFDDNAEAGLVKKHYCEDAVANLLGGRTVHTSFTQAFGGSIESPK